MQEVHSTDGTPIAFARSGDGPPLLLVHGSVADHTRWSPILPSLEHYFAVHALDRRGRGGSGDTEPYAIQREFEDIAAVIDSIGTPTNVLAHSFGAVCALGAALTSNIEKLILYEPPPLGVSGTLPPPTATKMQAHMDAGDHAAVISTFLLEVAGIVSHELELMRAHPSWQGRVAAAHTILREMNSLENTSPFHAEAFKAMTTSTLLLLGGESADFYKASIEHIHAILLHSQLVVLPGQKHVAINTAPDLFFREIIKFLLDKSA